MTTLPAPIAQPWSAAQRVRLEGEWRGLLRAFAYHPRIEVMPTGTGGAAEPAGEYQVQFKVTTLVVNEAGELAWVKAVPVHLWLPPHFPHEPPVVRPLVPVFHPNVTMEWFHVNPAWRPQATLVELVTQVGQALAFQAYDPNVMMNPVAMQWVYANPHVLPTDPAGDFTPAAGGEPLARLLRFGPPALEEVRRQAEAMVDRVLAATAPAPAQADMESLLNRSRLTVVPLGAPDVPDHLRDLAAEVEELVESLEGPDSVWEQLKRYAATARTIAAAAGDLVRAEEGLWKAVASLDAAAPRSDRGGAEDPSGPMGEVPPLATIQPLALGLRRAVRDAERAEADLRQRLGLLATPPRAPAAKAGGLLARLFDREVARASERAEPARASGAALASLEPVLQRARRESVAVDRVTSWAEYTDLLARGEALFRRVVADGPSNVQVFRMRVGGESPGPFQYEQLVRLSHGALAVSNPRGRMVRVVDGVTEEPVAAGEGDVPLPATGVVVSPSEHSDELRVQVEYLLTQTRETLGRLAEPLDPEQYDRDGSWAGRAAAALDAPEARGPILADHQRAREAWKSLLMDLTALGRLRQRQSTFHLLERLEAFAPRVTSEVDRLHRAAEQAGQRLAEIAARSQRDLETDRLIVPQTLARDYADRLAERDDASRKVRRLREALERLVSRAAARLAKPGRLGSAAVPKFRVLPPMSEPEESMAQRIDDRGVAEIAARVEKLVGKSLREAAVQRPATPAGAAGDNAGGGGGHARNA